MKRLLAILSVLVVSVIGLSAANDPAAEKAVTATFEAMAKATIAKDVATLAKIYSDDLTYSHSSARTETKAEVLKAVAGPSVVESMVFSETAIRLFGDVAVVKGVTDLRSGQPGKLNDNHLSILWVLVKRAEAPHGWQIVARQATRIGPPPGTPAATPASAPAATPVPAK
ncbi:MAG TPA: nuclear transport factor 2 family protein [Vicinamibacterales bacterium]|nr:nuclear transport factor 2 family protein [Vicinamibacterales bacterium]